jgi:hypothetical protein
MCEKGRTQFNQQGATEARIRSVNLAHEACMDA